MSDQTLPLEYYVNITVANDKLSASIHFTNCDDNFKCTIEQLEASLKSNYIIYGIHYDVLSKIAYNPKEYLLSKTIIATGDTPVDGEDGYIKYLYDLNLQNKKP